MQKLRRYGSRYPICSKVCNWGNLEEAVKYFNDQGLNNIEILHNIEIESCLILIGKLNISKEEFVSHIHSRL